MRDKYGFVKIFFVLLIVSISIGYAYLNANLNIDGTADIVGSNWNIHWDNVQVSSGSVTAATPTIDVNGTAVSYTITLNEPGDFYEFTIDAVNSGTLDGMISSITSTLDNEEIITLPDYLNYAVTYVDGTEVATNQLLAAGTSEKYKVRIEYKGDISADALPEADQVLHLSFGVTYVQANENAVEVAHPRTVYTASVWDSNQTTWDNGTNPTIVWIGRPLPNNIEVFDTEEEVISYVTNTLGAPTPIYLKHTVLNDIVIDSSVGFVVDNNMANYGMTPGTYYVGTRVLKEFVNGSFQCMSQYVDGDFCVSPDFETNKAKFINIFGASNVNVFSQNITMYSNGLQGIYEIDGHIDIFKSGWLCHTGSDGTAVCQYI